MSFVPTPNPLPQSAPDTVAPPLLEKLRTSVPVQWHAVFGASAVFLALLEALHLPAALMLGPMIGGIAVAAFGGRVRVPRPLYALAQALVGLMMARSLPASNLAEVAKEWPVFFAGVACTIAAAAAMGWLLTRWRVLPGTTAIWGSSPGAASTMIVMAEAFGADIRLVAFMQYVRIMCVAGLASLIASLAMAHGGHPIAAVTWFPAIDGKGFALTLMLALGGAVAGRVTKIPAGALLLPMIIANVLSNAGLMTIVLPPWLLAIAYALFGWTIGLRFTREILRHAARAFPLILAAVLVLVALCAGFGLFLSWAAGVDSLTAYLATSPGGADSVAIIAASSRVDVPFVMAMQMVRFLLVMVTGPALARFLAGRVPGAARSHLPTGRK